MQVKVLYFASLREALQSSGETLEIVAASVGDVRQLLASRGGEWARLTKPGIRAAVNHEMVADAQALTEGDELAFFPPVTGG